MSSRTRRSAPSRADPGADSLQLPRLCRAVWIRQREGVRRVELHVLDDRLAPVANGKPDAPARTVVREGLSYVTWSRAGRSYMFVARMPEQQVDELAQTLVARF